MPKLLLRWVITRIKVNIRSVSFWLMTVLVALALILSRRVIGQYSADTVVLLYVPEAGASEAAGSPGSAVSSDEVGAGGALGSPDDAGTGGDPSYGEWCSRYLVEHTPEGFAYEPVDSEEQLISRVSSGDVSCGVCFGADMSATIYQTAGSVDGYVVREMIYPVIAEYRYADELADYVRGLYPALSEEVLDGTADSAVSYVTDRYRTHMDELDLKLFEVRDMSTEGGGEQAADASGARFRQRARSLMRTVFALMLMLICGMCVYDTFHTDRAFYRSFSVGRRTILACSHVMITVVMSVAFAVVFTIVMSGGIRF